MSRLYLIRHGRTEANDRRLYCGSTDLPLSEAGRRELESLSYDISPELCFTSGMKRTEETFRILFGDRPHTGNRAFREIDFGDFEMKSYQDLKDLPSYQAWLTGDNDANVPPNGESGNQMTARVLEGLKPLLVCGKDVLIVSHGGVIASILASLFPEEEKSRYEWQPRPGHGYVIEGHSYRALP